MGKITTVEGFMLTTCKIGKSFYSEKDDKHITALANHYKVIVKTERMGIFNLLNPKEIKPLTKVTILSKK